MAKAAKNLTSVRTSTPVRAVVRAADHARVLTPDGDSTPYAAVVVAVHPDQALRLLADPTEDEVRILGAFSYSRNPTVLHRDTSLLPRSPHARASWNYWLPSCSARPESVQVSYDMNRLQQLPTAEPHIVTLNARGRVDPFDVIARMVYEHPVYTPGPSRRRRNCPG